MFSFSSSFAACKKGVRLTSTEVVILSFLPFLFVCRAPVGVPVLLPLPIQGGGAKSFNRDGDPYPFRVF